MPPNPQQSENSPIEQKLVNPNSTSEPTPQIGQMITPQSGPLNQPVYGPANPDSFSKPPSKKRKLYLISSLVLLLALAGGVIFIAYKHHSNKKPLASNSLEAAGVPSSDKIKSERDDIKTQFNQMVDKMKASGEEVVYDSGSTDTCYDSMDDEAALSETLKTLKDIGVNDPFSNQQLTPQQKADFNKAIANKKVAIVTSCIVERQIAIKSDSTKLDKSLSNITTPFKASGFSAAPKQEDLPQLVQSGTPKPQPKAKKTMIQIYESGKNYSPQNLPTAIDISKYLSSPSSKLFYIKIADLYESFNATLPLTANTDANKKTVLEASLYEGTGYSYEAAVDKQFQAIDWQIMRPSSIPIDKVNLVVTDTSAVLEFGLDSLNGGNGTNVKQFKFTDKVKSHLNPPQACNINDAIEAARLDENRVSAPKSCEKLSTTKKGYIIYGTDDLKQRHQTGYIFAQVNNTVFTYDFNSYGDSSVNQQNVNRFSSLLDELVPVDKNQIYKKV
ncbi:hypothetical protein KW794_01580 [Candidatus Saccharibacteria bacterium]|nr:hypothetical protein [Candidatus Saccharibacteria bacterium]